VVPYTAGGLDAEEMARLVADHLAQADYKYDEYVTVKKNGDVRSIDATVLASASVDAKRLRDIRAEARAIAAGVHTVRDLGNAPGNLITPTRLAERAEAVAKESGIKCTIYGRREIERMKMGGLLAVNRGSSEEPRFIVMEYGPRRAKKHVALVGKGITFDSGGISIKPAEKMEEMKFDMCGAAAVIGTMQAAAALELPIRITGAIPSTDNLPGGSAYKPGDIVTMMSGKTVEIVNTDAEGRMILGDALHYASELKPDHLIDYATLTGACVVALGNEAAGLFSNDDELARKLIECGERVGERLWRLPEWDDYKDLIRSDWADMKNSGGRWGGAITAALFLKEFVNCPSWAHLDIAGTAYAEHETAREARGATGAGVRVTLAFLESLSR
jgi:leucyl aminopeptidase